MFTLGSWVEEWILVILLGAVLSACQFHSAVYYALLYFVFGYALMYPVYCGDKFSLVVLGFGLISSFLLYISNRLISLLAMLLQFLCDDLKER